MGARASTARAERLEGGAAGAAKAPFLLLARVTVKAGREAEYLEAARRVDAAVQAAEAGMLHHTFDADPDGGGRRFVWSEAYRDDAALRFHLEENPAVAEYLAAHAELSEDFSVEVYGSLAPETEAWFSGLGFPVRFFRTALGYTRLLR